MKPIIYTATTLALALTACSTEGSSEEVGAGPVTDSAASATSVINVTAAEADELIASDTSLVVLDVRTPAEFAEGHVEGAINVDFRADYFAENLAKLDKSQRYVLHCKSGTRSSGALDVIKDQGFESIVHMNDGFDAWKAAGNPVAQ